MYLTLHLARYRCVRASRGEWLARFTYTHASHDRLTANCTVNLQLCLSTQMLRQAVSLFENTNETNRLMRLACTWNITIKNLSLSLSFVDFCCPMGVLNVCMLL